MNRPTHPLRAIVLLALLAAAAVSYARPEFLVLFNNTYKVDPSSALGKAQCMTCHTSPPQRNAYGKDLANLIKASGGKDLTADMLKQVEGLDSDGDGWSNGDEIKQGFLPGDPTSHPTGTPPKLSTPVATAKPAAASGWSIIPSNGFHPVVIHFPIALFLFGLFLEFVGLWKKIPALAVAALWNLSGALVSLAVVAPTGIAAWLIGGHVLEGAMLIHLLLAISSLIMMSVTLISRKKLGNESKVYLAILVLSAISVGLTGYFGGQLVYG